MGIELCDMSKAQPIEVEGTVIFVKPMTIGQRVSLAQKVADQDTSDYDGMCDIIGASIESIKGFDESPATFLKRIINIKDLLAVFDGVVSLNTLSDDDGKNSPSSSEPSQTDSMGTVAAVKIAKVASEVGHG